MSELKSDASGRDSANIQPLSNAGVTIRIVPGVVDVVVLTPTDGFDSTRDAPSERWRVLTLKRAPNTRCTGAWEIIHGRIESQERPEAAAVREVLEETGLAIARLYSITVNSFYMHQTRTVQLALVFAAVVESASDVQLGVEHDAFAWHSMRDAAEILAWPREREALVHVEQLLRTGNAGPVEDVLRII